VVSFLSNRRLLVQERVARYPNRISYKRGAGAPVVQIGDLRVDDVAGRIDQVVAHENDYLLRLLETTIRWNAKEE
jgi:hypothetical protein